MYAEMIFFGYFKNFKHKVDWCLVLLNWCYYSYIDLLKSTDYGK